MGVAPRSRLVAVAFALAVSGSSSVDVPSQLYPLGDISAPTAPSVFPDHLTSRLNGLAWANLSAPLQRAVLWDAGLIRAADNKYVQVYVPCDRTMNEIFLTQSVVTLADPSCKLYNCNQVVYRLPECSTDAIESATMCGISKASLTTLSPYTFASWAQEGQLDQTFDPVALHLQPSSGKDMAVILQYATLQLKGGNCPSRPSFVVPCRKLDDAVAAAGKDWCIPAQQFALKLWIKELTGSNPSAPAATTQHQSTEQSQESSSNTVAIVLAVALGVAVVLCVALFLLLRKARSAKDASARYTGVPATPHSAPAAQHNGGSSNGGSGNLSGSDVEVLNESYRKNSNLLAAFCADQALMMKRIAHSRLHFYEVIAHGANGEVWRAQHDGKVVAVKRVRAQETKDVDVGTLEAFTHEIRLAAMLEHPNIVGFIGLSWRLLSELSMISEYMPMGDLARLLETNEGKQLSWRDAKVMIAIDVANALVYLHSLVPQVLHRDLKSRNVLLDEQLTAKLSDFGLSRERALDETMTSGVGTMLWTAPEVLRSQQYDEKADIYSFGVLLTVLDTCLPPYSLTSDVICGQSKSMALMPLITRGEVKPRVSPNCPPPILNLAMQCLDQNPANRPPAMQVVYHLRSKIRPLL